MGKKRSEKPIDETKDNALQETEGVTSLLSVEEKESKNSNNISSTAIIVEEESYTKSAEATSVQTEEDESAVLVLTENETKTEDKSTEVDETETKEITTENKKESAETNFDNVDETEGIVYNTVDDKGAEETSETAIKSGEINEEDFVVPEIIDTTLTKLKGRKRRKYLRKHISDITLDNDIRYRGPLSYRHLRIIGWIFLFFAQYGVLLALSARINPATARSPELLRVLSFCKTMVMPLFLIATFATILNGSKTLKSLISLYGGAIILVYALFLLVHERFVGGLASTFFQLDHKAAVEFADKMLFSMNVDKHMTFNIFIDLMICTLVYLFLVYKPKRYFLGKKLLIFRCFTIFPVLYELTSLELKILAAYGVIQLPMYVYPLLTTKPPMTFIVFIMLIVYIKMREHIYKKNGKTHEQFQDYLKTNANSYQFSWQAAKLMFWFGLADVVLGFILTLIVTIAMIGGTVGTDEISVLFATARDLISKTGIGQSGALIAATPFVLLFSYTRKYKDTRFDTILPVIAVIVLILVYLEGVYQIITSSYEKINALIESFFGFIPGGE